MRSALYTGGRGPLAVQNKSDWSGVNADECEEGPFVRT
jgi:hypothetical protein